jgi:hypothetical protein
VAFSAERQSREEYNITFKIDREIEKGKEGERETRERMTRQKDKRARKRD